MLGCRGVSIQRVRSYRASGCVSKEEDSRAQDRFSRTLNLELTALPARPASREALIQREGGFSCLFLFFFFFLSFFRATPEAYGGSQAAGLRHSHSNSGSEPHLRPTPTAHGNARSVTHRARPGIKPASSWLLVGFVTTEPQQELLLLVLFVLLSCQWC